MMETEVKEVSIIEVPLSITKVEPQPSPSAPDEVEVEVELEVDVEAEDQQTQTQPKEQDEYQVRKRLIAEVEKYPNLWKYGHPYYRHRTIAQQTWDQISSEVAMPSEECRQIWNQVRAKYGANRGLSIETKNKLRYFNALSFLEHNYNFYGPSTPKPKSKSKAKSNKLHEAQEPDPYAPFLFWDFDEHGGGDVSAEFPLEHHFSETQTQYKNLLEDQLRTYDKDKGVCGLCNRKAKYESNLFLHTKKNKMTNSVIRDWKRGLVTSLCQLIELNPTNYVDSLESVSFCKSCHNILLDIHYWSNTAKALDHKLKSAKKAIENILTTKDHPEDPLEIEDRSADIPGSQIEVKQEIIVSEHLQEPDNLSETLDEPDKNESETFDEPDNNELETFEEQQIDTGTETESDTDEETVVISSNLKKWRNKYKQTAHHLVKSELIISSEDEDSLPKSKRSRCKKPKPTKVKKEIVRPRHFCQESGCAFSSQTAFLLSVHINKDHHADPEPFHCNDKESECKAKFSTFELLNQHKLTDHRSGAETTTSRACTHCGKIFSTRGSLRQHVKVRHCAYLLKPKCLFCSKAFATADEVEEHEQLHYMEPMNFNRYSCVLCNTLFQSQLELQRHVQTSHETDLAKCDLCNLVFLTEMRLKNHQYLHHKVQPKESLKCPEPNCGFQAKTPSSLRYHSSKHGEFTYKCDVIGCTAAYKWMAALKRHIRTTHAQIKVFVCPTPDCGKSFASAGDLRRHEVCHMDLRPFMCEYCPKQFKQRKHLVRHKKSHEKNQNQDTEGLPGDNPNPMKKVKVSRKGGTGRLIENENPNPNEINFYSQDNVNVNVVYI